MDWSPETERIASDRIAAPATNPLVLSKIRKVLVKTTTLMGISRKYWVAMRLDDCTADAEERIAFLSSRSLYHRRGKHVLLICGRNLSVKIGP